MEAQDSIKAFLSEVQMLGSNAITVSKELLPDGKEGVTLDLRRSKVMPERMESPPRAHVFYDVESFVLFVKKNKTKNTLVAADVIAGVIEAVLDDKAEKGFEDVCLRPALFPAFELLSGMIGRQLDITEFAKQVMRNRSVLGDEPDQGRQYALLMQQVTVASSIKACVGSGRKSVNGVMCTTEVKGGSGEDLVELPDALIVNVPLYVNRPSLRFLIDITVMASSRGEVAVRTDAPELKVLQYQEIKEMADEVGHAIKDEVTVVVGHLDTGSWSYNK